MKRIIYSLMIAALVFCVGCDKNNADARDPKEVFRGAVEEAARARVAKYRALLVKRKNSVGGANINILQEVRKFEKAREEEQLELLKKAEELAK